MYYTNANDLKNKRYELERVCNEHQCKVICITETMLNKDILDAELLIANFRIFRVDRVDMNGGGSCIYVHNSINCSVMSDFSVQDCIAVKLETNIPIILICVYRSPSLTYNENIMLIKKLSDFLSKINNECEVVICGDFNLP